MLKLPNNYRVRRNWRGKLILQKIHQKAVYDSWGYAVSVDEFWKDCSWADVTVCQVIDKGNKECSCKCMP